MQDGWCVRWQLFVIVNDGMTFIPITDLAGKSEEDNKARVAKWVTADVMSRLVEVSGDAAAPSKATREAWGYINPKKTEEATQQAAQFAAQQAASIASHMAIEDALEALDDGGSSEAEIDAFIEANPAPSN